MQTILVSVNSSSGPLLWVFIVQFVENKIENPKHKFSSSASEPASAKTVAMRASGGTNCGLPSVVLVLTNFQFLCRTGEGIRDQPTWTNRLLSCRPFCIRFLHVSRATTAIEGAAALKFWSIRTHWPISPRSKSARACSEMSVFAIRAHSGLGAELKRKPLNLSSASRAIWLRQVWRKDRVAVYERSLSPEHPPRELQLPMVSS